MEQIGSQSAVCTLTTKVATALLGQMGHVVHVIWSKLSFGTHAVLILTKMRLFINDFILKLGVVKECVVKLWTWTYVCLPHQAVPL